MELTLLDDQEAGIVSDALGQYAKSLEPLIRGFGPPTDDETKQMNERLLTARQVAQRVRSRVDFLRRA